VTADEQTEAAVVGLLERFTARIATGEVDPVLQLFAPDDGIAVSISDEPPLRGPNELRAFLQRYAHGTTRYTWAWSRREVSAAGDQASLLAEGTESGQPYQLSMRCERRGGRWLIVRVDGSSPPPG
jgi:hypothetical protein